MPFFSIYLTYFLEQARCHFVMNDPLSFPHSWIWHTRHIQFWQRSLVLDARYTIWGIQSLGMTNQSWNDRKMKFPSVKFIYSEKATKLCLIFTLLLTVCTVVKSKLKISQNFVAFSEYMNFKNTIGPRPRIFSAHSHSFPRKN